MSAQMELSDEVFYERFDRLVDAINSNDLDGARKIAHGIPLPPELAMQRRSYMSKERILDLGYDMSLVEAKYGKDWYETTETVGQPVAPEV